MASFIFNNGALDISNGAIDLDTDTLQVMLTATATLYTEDRDDDFVDESGANDPIDAELSVAGYTGGFGGAGRKVAAITSAVDKPNNRAEFGITDITWTGLAAGETIDHALLIDERTNDADSRLVACFDIADTPTSGGDVTLDFDTTDDMRLSTV